ncbi:MAG: hypothetical protein AB7U97_25100, partial [Pirellulales bacterium]
MWVLIAILAADVLALIVFSGPAASRQHMYVLNLWGALAIGQVSLISVWLAFREKHDWLSVVVPALGLAAASYIRLYLNFFPGFQFLDFICRNALQGLVSLVVLWPLARTNLWRRLSGDEFGLRLEFSVKQLLFWMTSVAVFATLIGRS